MSDEEKKAIKKVKYICDKWYDENLEIDVKWLESLLSLCEKQSKEIEELKDKYSDEKIRNTVIKRFNEVIEKDYVSKDKIKAKIEEVDYKMIAHQDVREAVKQVLQSLLEKE